MDTNELIETIAEIRTSLATITATCKPCREQVGRVVEMVDGNGRDGLKARVVRLETRWVALGMAMPILSAIIAAVISKVFQ